MTLIWNLDLKNVPRLRLREADTNRVIQELEQGKMYKYLGIEKGI